MFCWAQWQVLSVWSQRVDLSLFCFVDVRCQFRVAVDVRGFVAQTCLLGFSLVRLWKLLDCSSQTPKTGFCDAVPKCKKRHEKAPNDLCKDVFFFAMLPFGT